MEHVSIIHTDSGRPIVSDVGFALEEGHCLGIVGESGSGKTLICRALLGLLPPSLHAEGVIRFEQTDMLTASSEETRQLRGTGIGSIFQQPMTAFDPLYTLGDQFVETLGEKLQLNLAGANALARYALALVKLPEAVMKSYPHQLSGGMLQRCMIALTLAMRSRLVVADEPTTALDAANQYEVLQRFRRLREEHNVSLIIVSHDLGAVQMLADSLLVMCRGRCVEAGDAESVFNAPQHPYTQYLVSTRLALICGFRRVLGERNVHA
ncbi:MAG: ABC transporter ATP-binding protein [Desulfovibrio sp.]|nr:ABC transporter ATP-binding protein [Desulfovibrio sp.]